MTDALNRDRAEPAEIRLDLSETTVHGELDERAVVVTRFDVFCQDDRGAVRTGLTPMPFRAVVRWSQHVVPDRRNESGNFGLQGCVTAQSDLQSGRRPHGVGRRRGLDVPYSNREVVVCARLQGTMAADPMPGTGHVSAGGRLQPRSWDYR